MKQPLCSLLTILFISLLLGACTGNIKPSQISTATIEALITKAEGLRAEAATAGHEWINQQPTIEEARVALANNDLDTALAKAELATLLGEQSVKQATDATQTWQQYMPTSE